MQIQRQLVMALAAMLPVGKLHKGASAETKEKLLQTGQNYQGSTDANLPVDYPPAIVLWHGLGDHYDSDGMVQAAELIAEILPKTFVYSVYLEEDSSLDERRSLFGDANEEVKLACERLSNVTELKDGFGAIGFSQGGLFLRALIERCPTISVSKLVTFGSPHMGVLELPLCQPQDDWACRQRNKLLKRQVWNDSVQKRVIPAQYFRDMAQYDKYLEHLNFLADLNNERPSLVDSGAKERFESLEKLVLVQFNRDETLVPKESAFFQEVHGQTGRIVPIEETRAYAENLFGLRTLIEEDKVDYHTIDDRHMSIPEGFLRKIVTQYFAGNLDAGHS